MSSLPKWVLNPSSFALSLSLSLLLGCAASDGSGTSGIGGSISGQGAVGGLGGVGGVGGTGAVGGGDASTHDAGGQDATLPTLDSSVANDAAIVTDATVADAMTPGSDAAIDASTVDDAGSDATVSMMDASLDGSSSDGSMDAGNVVDANYADVAPDSRAGYCMGQGPPITVNDSRDGITYDACTGAIAGRVFTNSVCTCDDINMGGFLRTRSFHSGQGQTPDQAIAFGAPVGSNDTYRALGYTEVGGSMVIAGESNTLLYQYMTVGGDLKMNGELGLDPSFIVPAGVGYLEINRDAWFKDDVYMSVLGIVPTGVMNIGRDLHQPTGQTLSALAFVGGSLYWGNTPFNQPFTVPEPCACGADEILDIDAMVDNAQIHNDNADINLSPDVFNLNLGIFLDLTLPCGRFYVNNIGSLGIVTLHVPGRTALFVGGSVGDLGIFDVDLGPQGELDIFIKGNLVSIGATSFGDRNRPSATRVYVSGSGDVAIVGLGEFVGNVYAPNARIFSAGYAQVYGSLFGREVDMLAGLDVFYDRDILDVGEDCPPEVPETDAGVPTGGSGGSGGTGGAGGMSGTGGTGGMSGTGGIGGTGGTGGSPPPPVCTQCSNSCANRQACVDNMCVGCTDDSQCCAPLVCYPSSGRCGPLLE